jgi:hypothetical protein
MKWDDDPNCYEKRISFDVIAAFIREFDGVDHNDISMKYLNDFIDEYFETKKKGK